MFESFRTRIGRWFGANRRIELKLEEIMASQKELATQLDEVTAQLQKVGNESALTLQKVNDLEAIIAQGGEVGPELQAAFDALKAQVKTVDDLVPDAEDPNPAEGGTTPPAA